MAFQSLLAISNYLTSAKINKWHRIQIPLKVFTDLLILNQPSITSIVFTQNNNDGSQHEVFIDDIELLPGISL